jgi:hypothetical protein
MQLQIPKQESRLGPDIFDTETEPSLNQPAANEITLQLHFESMTSTLAQRGDFGIPWPAGPTVWAA